MTRLDERVPELAAFRPPEGVWDEWRDTTSTLRPEWTIFTAANPITADVLREAGVRVSRQIHENGVTYNAYMPDGPERPWALDPLPLLVPAATWRDLDAPLRQVARLVNAIGADIYGDQVLLREGVLPPSLVFAHAGFLRCCHGATPPKGIYLHVGALDLVHGPDGAWRLAGLRTQAPSGLGYALENRATVGRVFAPAARALHARALAPFTDAIRRLFTTASPGGGEAPHVVLLTPGSFNETYFEHVYLSRELGFTLVHGGDLIVRHAQVFLKTVTGLRRVHAIWRRQDDDYCDPLELRADSTLGVPGLMQSWRTGGVLVANSFGLGPLESPALLPCLAPACERLLGEPLTIEIAPSPAAPSLSHAPVWHDGTLESRAVALRTFVAADGRGDYAVLPGGLTRAAADDGVLVSGHHGGVSKDTWIVSTDRLEAPPVAAADERSGPAAAGGDRTTSSRSADHLFWLGRYAERSENNVRLIRAVLKRLPEAASRPTAFRYAVAHTCRTEGVLLDEDFSERSDLTSEAMASIERGLMAGLSDRDTRTSLAFNVSETFRVAAAVRERLSSDNWRVLTRLQQSITARASDLASVDDTFEFLDDAILLLVAVGGLETTHMTRDDGWRFLSLGRHLERLSFVATTLESISMHRAMYEPAALEWLLDLSDSLITYRSRHLQHPAWAPVLDLLLFDERNPRAGMFQVNKIDQLVRHLPGHGPLEVLREIQDLHSQGRVSADRNHDIFGGTRGVDYLLRSCTRVASRLSDAVTLRYFSHVYGRTQATVTT